MAEPKHLAKGPAHHPLEHSGITVSNGWLTAGAVIGYLVVFGFLTLVRVHEIDKPITFEFRADQAGTFPFYCNLQIDDGCRQMRGELVVKPRK